MKNLLIATTAVVILTVGAEHEAQAVISFDANVTPDVIYGSLGNDNGGWTVDLNNNVEVGLRTHQRLPNPTNDFNSNGDGTYSWTSGPPAGNKVNWNYDFSINLNQDGNVTRLFSNVIIELDIDTKQNAGQNFVTIDPLAFWDDNEYGDNSTGPAGGDESNPTNADRGVSAGFYVAQNSQNIGFLGFSHDGPATWDFQLRVRDAANPQTILAETAISVLIDGGAIPEPASAGLAFMGLIGLAGAVRRRVL